MLKTGVKPHVDTKGTQGGVFWMQLVDLAFLFQAIKIQNFNVAAPQR
jgi:hypothetical protein